MPVRQTHVLHEVHIEIAAAGHERHRVVARHQLTLRDVELAYACALAVPIQLAKLDPVQRHADAVIGIHGRVIRDGLERDFELGIRRRGGIQIRERQRLVRLSAGPGNVAEKLVAAVVLERDEPDVPILPFDGEWEALRRAAAASASIVDRHSQTRMRVCGQPVDVRVGERRIESGAVKLDRTGRIETPVSLANKTQRLLDAVSKQPKALRARARRKPGRDQLRLREVIPASMPHGNLDRRERGKRLLHRHRLRPSGSVERPRRGRRLCLRVR